MLCGKSLNEWLKSASYDLSVRIAFVLAAGFSQPVLGSCQVRGDFWRVCITLCHGGLNPKALRESIRVTKSTQAFEHVLPLRTTSPESLKSWTKTESPRAGAGCSRLAIQA